MNRKYISILITFSIMAFTGVNAGPFDFSKAEMQLVETANETYPQSQLNVTFDPVGNVHAVYLDNRVGGVTHPYGLTFTDIGILLPESYPAYDTSGIELEPQIFPFIVPSTYTPDKSYCMVVNTNGTMWQHQMSNIWTSALPFPPTITLNGLFGMNTSYTEYLDVVSGMNYIFYAYPNAGDITLNRYDESDGSWTGESTSVVSGALETFTAPALAMDDMGYIYLAYHVIDLSSSNKFIRVRRSVAPFDVAAWHDEWEVAFFFGSAAFEPAIAATGSTLGTDLKVAISWLDPDPGFPQVIGSMDDAIDWTSTTPGIFGSYGPYVISQPLPVSVDILGPDIAYDSEDGLYVVWADDRDAINRKLHGNYSRDGGVSFDDQDDVHIAGIEEVREAPCLAVGDTFGDIAIGFIRYDGGLFNPYMLVKNTKFFDKCDQDPATTGFWDSYAGINVTPSIYYSYPASYMMTTSKGTLLQDYGTVENQGSVSLQFFDTMSTSEDFYIALENNNTKGVIRMLGVRNDTTQSNYSYSFDGTIWTDMGAVRSSGWHEIQFNVNSGGLTMQIEDDSKEIIVVTDPGFTSFTSIELQGGGSTGAYLVDDIQVETYPLSEEEPRPIPSTSGVALVILLGAMGLYLGLRRK